MLKRHKSACWLNIATLLTGFAAFEVYRSLSLADAEYQGETPLYFFSVIAPVVIWSVIAWELVCVIGVRRWRSIGFGIQGQWKKAADFLGRCSVKTRRIMLCVCIALAVLICGGVYGYINKCDTRFYDEIAEFYGIPDGVGDPLSPEELKERAGYWRIDNYPLKHRMTLTYVDAYGQMELMREYSSAYDRMFFQPPVRVEYCYRVNKDKFRAGGRECYNQAKKHGFREPERITYYAGNGKVLLELSGEGYEMLKVDAYASEETPQLLYSTLFRFPEGQTVENGIASWQLETSYDIDGMPVMRKLSGGICNLYGVNGERYVYDSQHRLESICYLDANGQPACNKQGIMLVTFQYDEDGCKIAYYSDESGTERTEGFYGVYCEELKYDSWGNIEERRQRDKQGRWCCDVNGVYKYVYEYAGGRLISEAYFGVDELPVKINGWDSQRISFSLKLQGKEQIIEVFLDGEGEKTFSRSMNIALENNNRTESFGLQAQNMSSVREADNLYVGDGSGGSPESSQVNNQPNNQVNNQGGSQADGLGDDWEKKRNYTSIQNIITKDSLLIKFQIDGKTNIENEWGYAAKRILYDEKMRVKEEAYLDLNGEPCLTEDGYAMERTIYRSKEDDKIEFIEYLDTEGHRTMNTDKGYSYVHFQYGRQGESEVVTSLYFDPEENPVYLPGLGYAAVDRLYNKNGFLIQETYRDKNGVITNRNDYMVAEILYEYADDGNLSRIWYKDVDEKPTNRLDTGYAVVYQEYNAGQLARRHYEGYRNRVLCAVPDKTTGVCETVYEYAKGRLQQAQYFDTDGRPVLSSDQGCAAVSYEYDDNGNISCWRYYGTDGELILCKDTGYAVISCEYNDEEQYKLFRYFGVDEQPVIHAEKHCAGIKEIYDGDKLVETQYLNLDGSLMNRSDYGFARIERTYYADGNLRTEEYFDAAGGRAVRKEYGYAMSESFYNEDGTLRERRYYDFPEGERELVMRRDVGYAIIRYGYDEKGNRTSQTYYDTEEQPVVSAKYRCAGILSEYDDYGNEIGTCYIDRDGSLMNRDDYGFAQVERVYGVKLGELLSEAYLDTESRPAVRKEYGCSSYEQRFDEYGNWVETRYYDAEDRLILREDTGYAIVRNEYNEFGGLSAQRFYGQDEEPIISTEYHCAGFLYDYDKMGRRWQTSYLGLDGQPADRSDMGCAYTRDRYDDAGRVIEESYFGADGQPVIRRDCGYASIKKIYAGGRLARETYYGLGERLVPDKDTGYAMIEWEYDKYGNIKSFSFYGVDKKPVISSKYQCAVIENGYDEMGNNTEIRYLDFDGRLMNRGDYGCAKIRQEFDSTGDIIKAFYYDAKEQPVIRKDLGYASYEKIFDRETGKWSESRYYNTQGELTLCKDYGYAVIRVEYDSRGREEIYTYHGTDEEPIINTYYYCAGMKYEYDERGNRIKIQYLSPDGSPMMRIDFGCAQVEQKYSASGRLIGEVYLDEAGEPAIRKNRGYASYEDIYSQNGMLLESRYYGLDGKLVLREDLGYAVVRYVYDAYGRQISRCFLGTDEKPIISSEYHCAGIRYGYENGNETQIHYYGLDGQLMAREDFGCAQVWKEYDDFGYVTKETYLDADGQTVMRKDLGYAICKKEYDPYHRWVEDRYYDAAKSLTLTRDTGVAILRLVWDAYGREGRYEYYGRDQQPVLNRRYYCYGMRYSYDELGNQTLIEYLGPEGEGMVRSDFGCMQVKREYDAWGQMTKETFCDGEGQPVIKNGYGYAAYAIEYDGSRQKEIRYLDTQDKPAVRTDTGYAMVRYSYNPLGQRTLVSYYDTENNLTLHKEDNCAGIQYTYDERGNRSTVWYCGLDGGWFVRKDYGAMLNFVGYDKYDRVIWDAYYIYDKDAGYQPVIRKDVGYFAIRYTYSEQGQKEKKQYLDTEKEPVLHKENGYAECRWLYNEEGQLEYMRYYDGNAKPVNGPGGYAEIEYIYNASGNVEEYKYRDLRGNEVTPK